MRKPKLELDLLPIIEKQLKERRIKKRSDVLCYVIYLKGLEKNFDVNNLSTSSEPHEGRMAIVHRYKKEFLFREFTTGKLETTILFELDE